MAIRITRNDAGNCINFVGSSNPAYWNACLSAVINSEDSNRVDIINDIRSENEDEIQYEFYAVDYNDFADKDNNAFTSAQQMVDYVNENANVVGVSGVGADLTDTVVNFRLDQTSTSIIMDNGSAFGVNTIKAVPDTDGTIHIHAIGAGVPNDEQDENEHKHFEKLIHTNVQINGTAVSGGLNDVVNALNELFTVGPFEAVVISDPHSTMVADVNGTTTTYNLVGSHAVDPVGNSIFGATQNTNYAGLKTVDTIDQAGEYYTFDIRGEGQLGFGLIHTDASYAAGHYTGNATYANPANFATYNSQHGGWQFSHHFHLTPNGSWTNYGANTAFVRGPGWYNWESQDEWLAGDPVKVRCGIDENGFIYVSTLQDDNTTWVMHARSGYPVPEGSEYHLGIKIGRNSSFVETVPKVHLLEEEAPTMNFRYIESPDGNFEYPLFATEEEANYYDENHQGTTGTGTSHTHTYDDDPTATTWYMPTTGNTMTGTAAPAGLWLQDFGGITYTEITSLTNADLTPSQFTNADLTYQEGTAVNIPLQPVDTTYSTSVSISPSGSGLVYDTASKMLQGTLADVTVDTTYTITVTRANSYGSSIGSFTITATNVAPTNTQDTPYNKALDFSGGSEYAQMVSGDKIANPWKMGGTNNQVSAPTAGNTVSSGHPWACTIVFNADGNSSNQHIWNLGEGAGTNDDNIYLRLSANRELYFGWGRSGDQAEMRITPDNAGSSWTLTAGNWYGIYVAHNGRRLGSGFTAADMASCFDVRLMGSSANWAAAGYSDTNLSESGAWNGSCRMNRVYDGNLTLGGRGSNRNFHGKIASFVMTTLRQGVAMPSDAEVHEMIIDPVGWLNDYKVGNSYRNAGDTNEPTGFAIGGSTSARATQVWIMGDGSNDSYSNMMRNQVQKTDQNYTKLNMISMVSNDIQTVNISGLT